jgi:RNA polymerase sigma factor (TIGR02999 family)
MSEVPRILGAIQQGDPKAGEQLLPLVYQELRTLAAYKMSRESPGQTLQPTALVHEAWLKLVGNEQQVWQNRAHFFGAAAEAMRRILIDNARRKQALRHGGGQRPLDIAEIEVASEVKDEELLDIHEALDAFAAQHPDKAELVKLRYFVGMKFDEASQILNISEPTAKRWWAFSRAWLFDHIQQRQTT